MMYKVMLYFTDYYCSTYVFDDRDSACTFAEQASVHSVKDDDSDCKELKKVVIQLIKRGDA